MAEGKLSEKIFWSGLVIDNQDPLMLNRVRVTFDSSVDGQSNASILSAVPDSIDGKNTKTSDLTDLNDNFKWSIYDPFCFLPLLPLFLKVTPKIGEAVTLVYPNPLYKKNEQYYIQGPFSSPKTIFRQDFEASRMFATKDRIIDATDPRNLKKSGTDEFLHTPTDGVFPDVEDVALIGRGTADIIIKENDVLIRAGKSTEKPDSPVKNMAVKQNRSFIQLSNFETRIDDGGTKVYYRPEIESVYVKYLVEWNIKNPENTQNVFNLEIKVYNLKENIKYTTKNFSIDTEVNPIDASLAYSYEWNNLSATGATPLTSYTVSDKVNEFIFQFNKGQINLSPYPITNVSNNFPFIFRPAPNTYKYIKNPSPTNLVQFLNITRIKNQIQYKTEKNGYGLVFAKDLVGQQATLLSETLKILNYSQVPTTYNVQAADTIYLLSHQSQIGVNKIILDDKTVKKIEQDFLIDKVFPYTNSSVRGEELLKLLNLIVQFLVAHTHPFWLIPPIPQAGNVTVAAINKAMSEADTKILNKNIRIN